MQSGSGTIELAGDDASHAWAASLCEQLERASYEWRGWCIAVALENGEVKGIQVKLSELGYSLDMLLTKQEEAWEKFLSTPLEMPRKGQGI